MVEDSSPKHVQAALQQFTVVVPAAGVGKRMQAHCPKQYLVINGVSILEHTVKCLLSHPQINRIILCLSAEDAYFSDTLLADHPDVIVTDGGKERVDSVLKGLKALNELKLNYADSNPWVLVHDAARPCVNHQDIDALIYQCIERNIGGLLAAPVRDTMKRGDNNNLVTTTVERAKLWHALTPQMYKATELMQAIEQGIASNSNITDESSAIELAGLPSLLVTGSSENIKITHPDDLAFAEFILNKQSLK